MTPSAHPVSSQDARAAEQIPAVWTSAPFCWVCLFHGEHDGPHA